VDAAGTDPAPNRAYIGRRDDLLALVASAPANVLEVGCAQGATGHWLKDKYGCAVTGVEIDPSMAATARTRLDTVLIADLNRTSLDELLGSTQFDLILMGDVLEHLVDPWTALRQARAHFAERGRIVTSLPNVNHYTTILSLIFARRWPYRSRGIHDRTHLRFFTRKNLVDMYAEAELTIEREHRNLRIFERPVGFNNVARIFDFHPFRSYMTYQYLHRLRAVTRA